MTLENANEIRNLLNYRDSLIRELKDLTKCKSIDGHINDGENGVGFHWNDTSRQIKYLIRGTEEEIRRVEEKIIGCK